MKVYNFSAGPSILPKEVIDEIKNEFDSFEGMETSMMELNHRSSYIMDLMDNTREEFKRIAGISDDYEVLFLQGGASLQFAMVPLNLNKHKRADYVITGHWSKKAMEEASKFTDAKAAETNVDGNLGKIPTEIKLRDDIDYVHITENNTIYGSQYHEIPDVKGNILVSDASSCILSRRVDFNQFGLVYAGAQKNLGIAGLTVVVIRKDLIKDIDEDIPTLLNYKIHYDKLSRYNTPPTFAIYVLSKLLKWIDSKGGLDVIEKLNKEKAKLLYDYLDQSKLFKPLVEKEDRSLMNVIFAIDDKELEDKFIDESKKAGFLNLKGHRSLGHLRASIYNAMPKEYVQILIDFMKEFEKNNM